MAIDNSIAFLSSPDGTVIPAYDLYTAQLLAIGLSFFLDQYLSRGRKCRKTAMGSELGQAFPTHSAVFPLEGICSRNGIWRGVSYNTNFKDAHRCIYVYDSICGCLGVMFVKGVE